MRTWAVIVVAVAAAWAVSALSDGECSKISRKCPGDGSKCLGDYFINGTEGCRDSSKCCSFPLHCVNGKCREDTRNRECKDDTECVAAYYGTGLIACVGKDNEKKCIIQGSFNDSCTKDEHCSGSQKCVKDKCNGIAENKTCDPSKGFQCGFNRTCVDNVCKLAVVVGEKCQKTEECDVYSLCNDGKCINRWSVKEGGKCEDKDACGKGLYCDVNEQKCKKAVKRKHVTCTNDTDCLSYGNTSQCKLCDSITGKMYCSDPENVKPDCISEWIAAYKCYRKHGCAPNASSSLDTCAQSECTAETNAVFACKTLCDDKKNDYGKKCIADIMLRYCPLIPTWLRIVIAFSILIVIIIVVFICYGIYNCCCRKKEKGYTPVDDNPQ